MKSSRTGLALMLASIGLSMLFGNSVGNSVPGGVIGFQGIYYGTRCLLQGCDPYNPKQLAAFYQAQGGDRPHQSTQRIQAVTLYVNMPTTFVLIAPFAWLSWAPAHLLWFTLVTALVFLAAYLMWRLAEIRAPAPSLLLICVMLANSEVLFATGNAAGLVISLCTIGVWCFLQHRWVWLGILCLAVSLVVKPHDSGFVWLFFLLAGGPYRKSALQTFALASAIGVVALVWVSHAVPSWLSQMRANLIAISGPGGINHPGPASMTGNSANMVIDLQAAFSVLKDDSHFYNPATYLVCGLLLVVWATTALRTLPTLDSAWLALAVIVPITLLVTYHRPYDAKLLLLAMPACAALWAQGKKTGRFAFLVTAMAIVATSDIPLVLSIEIARHLQVAPIGLMGKLLTVALTRPASVALLVMAVFYLWIYVQHSGLNKEHKAETAIS